MASNRRLQPLLIVRPQQISAPSGLVKKIVQAPRSPGLVKKIVSTIRAPTALNPSNRRSISPVTPNQKYYYNDYGSLCKNRSIHITSAKNNRNKSLTPSTSSSKQTRKATRSRTITVYENGAVVKGGEYLSYFKYTFSTKNNYKDQADLEMKKFFRTWQNYFNTPGSKVIFNYIFLPDGHEIRNLHEIPGFVSSIFVSTVQRFIGVQKFDCRIDNPVPRTSKILDQTLITQCATEDNKSREDEKPSEDTDPNIFRRAHRARSINLSRLSQSRNSKWIERPEQDAAARSVINSNWGKPRDSHQPKNYVKKNIAAYSDVGLKAERNIDKEMGPLAAYNIQELIKEFRIPRRLIHELYAKFKSLVIINANRNNVIDFKGGIDIKTFQDCSSLFSTGNKEILRALFAAADEDNSGAIDWKEFLTIISAIRMGDPVKRIDLFFRLYDSDKSGTLDFGEIQHIFASKFGHYMAIQNDEFLASMGEFLARSVYDMVKVPYDGELTKEQVTEGLMREENQEIMELFCTLD